MNVGEEIRNIRKKKGLSQKALGDLAGIAEPTIRRYELGSLNPKYETLQKIADALGVSVAAFLNYDSDNKELWKDLLPAPDVKSAILQYHNDMVSIINKLIADLSSNPNQHNFEVLAAYVSSLQLFYESFSGFDLRLIGIDPDAPLYAPLDNIVDYDPKPDNSNEK